MSKKDDLMFIYSYFPSLRKAKVIALNEAKSKKRVNKEIKNFLSSIPHHEDELCMIGDVLMNVKVGFGAPKQLKSKKINSDFEYMNEKIFKQLESIIKDLKHSKGYEQVNRIQTNMESHRALLIELFSRYEVYNDFEKKISFF